MKRCLPAIFFFALCATVHAQLLAPIVNFGKPRAIASGNSLIFTAASSQYLSITGKTTINRQKFTFSCWYHASSTSINQTFYEFGDGTANNFFFVQFQSSNVLDIEAATGGSSVAVLKSTATYTDTTSWHNLLVGTDTTQTTAANRIKPYYDGTLITSFGTSTYPSQNTNLSINYAATYTIGERNTTGNYLNAHLAQCYYIDGQQLMPPSFITGLPGLPMAYSGTYTGNLDFFLPFSNGTSTTTLGADSSGESNNWTLNNMTTANQSTDYP